MDAEGPDAELLIPNGKRIKKVQVGKNMLNYGSMLVLSHFKGHPMGGFGGALKNVSIGIASSNGKRWIHWLRLLLRQGIYPRCRRAGEDLDRRPRLVS